MARKHKEVKIDDKDYTIKELRVKDIYRIIEDATADAKPQEGEEAPSEAERFKAMADKHLPKTIDKTVEELMELAPSELETLYDAFKEVNGTFFKIAQKLGLTTLLEGVKDSLSNEFSEMFVVLSREAMAKQSGSTATPSS